jgi:2-oxoisovalerate dehydrogenase E1 component
MPSISQAALLSEFKEIASQEYGDKFSTYQEELEEAILIRNVELKLLDLFSKGKLGGTVHTCVGQELVAVIVGKYLKKNDWVTSNHRCHGHFIAKTKNWHGLLYELLGDERGVSKGIGSSQHLYEDGFISNGTQGSLLPVASGMGISKKLKESDGIVASFIGEGTLGEGVLYEALNLSSLNNSNHLIVVENNLYSQTTPQSHGVSGSIKDRAKAFGIEYFESNSWDIENLDLVCKKATNFIRDNKRPAMLHIKTYRLLAHSKGDDDRATDEVRAFEDYDLINKYIKTTAGKETNKKSINEIDNFIDKVIEKKILIDFDTYKIDQLPRKNDNELQDFNNDKLLLVKALNKSYFKLLNDGYHFVGEDIADPYGGAFKVTKGFQDHKPDQVFSTPISEAGLVGLSIGLNLMGQKSISEIMFGDFIVNATDQIINNACKFHHMYGNQINCSLILRTPMGGRRGYGPTHSQSIEKIFLGQENLGIYAINSLIDPDKLIKDISANKSPSIIIENKVDYGKFLWSNNIDGLSHKSIGSSFSSLFFEPDIDKEKFPIHITIACYGNLARMVVDNYLKIFTKSNVRFNVIVFQQLHPIPVEHLEYAIKDTNKCLVLEDGPEAFGWCDGVIANLSKKGINRDYHSLSALPVSIASVRDIEDKLLVSVDKIVTKMQEMSSKV